jgi:hypothetical protein
MAHSIRFCHSQHLRTESGGDRGRSDLGFKVVKDLCGQVEPSRPDPEAA